MKLINTFIHMYMIKTLELNDNYIFTGIILVYKKGFLEEPYCRAASALNINEENENFKDTTYFFETND